MSFKVAFFGTPEITLPVLDFLNDSPFIDLCLIVANCSKPLGRKKIITHPASIEFAKKKSLPFFQTNHIKKELSLIEDLKKSPPDLILVFSFSQFLSEEILHIPKLGCFNIHTSLLPKYRGASPIHQALLNNDKQTGISLQKMVLKMDAGDIALQEKIALEYSDHYSDLVQKIKQTLPLFLSRFFENLLKKNLHLKKQQISEVSFAPLIKKEDGLIHFDKLSFNEIFCMKRAYHLWPNLFFFFNHQKIKLFDFKITKKILLKPGEFSSKDGLFVGCKDSTLELLSVQKPGKKAMNGLQFVNGLRNK